MSLLGSSGIILTNEAAAALPLNGTHDQQAASAVPNFQPPMGWPNHIPQYYYPPPYQGYPYPMMPGQNQGNMPWPSYGKASKKKEDSDGDESSESSESDSESDGSASSLEDQGHTSKKKSRRSSKKNRKKASKTVIIRNINYITPEGRNGDMEGNEFTENGSIKETVDTAVGFLKDNRFTVESWV